METKEAYVSWSAETEEVYNEEGDVIGEKEYAQIHKLFVPADQRGKGLGRKLIEQAIQEAKEAGHKRMVIVAEPFDDMPMDMHELADFYISCGFDPMDTASSSPILEMVL